jgi:drug/metabolite transporter (DMT)-like permease
VATVILGHFVFKEQLSVRGWIAAGGTLLAAILLAGFEGGSGIIAVVLIASGCLCWGFDNHLTALIDGISPAQTTLWKGIVAGTFNLLIGGVVAGGAGSPTGIAAALVVGGLSYGLSIWLYIAAAQGLGATRSQMVFSVAPFFGLLLSVTILGESFTAAQAVAGFIIVLSLVILFSDKHAHIHRHKALSHQHRHRHDDIHHDHTHEDGVSKENHAHWHQHRPQKHSHDHWPDLHHRHDHDDEDEGQPPEK